eukprot:TRINITY_DN36305_c0_g1_i1.p1 TRINITY_DN36305_c0_g1~~TRINITY_DN36305_c0_g1_i1.p1  ORF type:complete len:105 (-),score=33.91 TRINITY_DN36305_c0_g1_i1:55-369(-)
MCIRDRGVAEVLSRVGSLEDELFELNLQLDHAQSMSMECSRCSADFGSPEKRERSHADEVAEGMCVRAVTAELEAQRELVLEERGHRETMLLSLIHISEPTRPY